MRTKYAGLAHIWKIIALDLGLLLAEWIIYLLDIFLLFFSADALAAIGDIENYLFWTVRCLRPMAWIGMIVLLPRSEEGFHGARIWYLMRIVAFFSLLALFGLSGQIDQGVGVLLLSGRITVSAAVYILLSVLIVPLLVPFGNRAILKAGGAILDFFGLKIQAKKNRRCGKLLAIFSCLLVGMILVFLTLWCFILHTTKSPIIDYLEAPDGSALIQWAMVILPVLILVCGIGILILWAMSAARMKRTYGLVKGLSE